MPAFHVAASHGRDAFLEVFADFLVADGAQYVINLTDSEGRTALHAAAAKASIRCVAALLRASANPNVASNGARRTPLHEAAGSSEPCATAVVRALLAAGASTAARDYWGRTPLLSACNHASSTEMVAALLAASGGSDALEELEITIGKVAGTPLRKYRDSPLRRVFEAGIYNGTPRGVHQIAAMLLEAGANSAGECADSLASAFHAALAVCAQPPLWYKDPGQAASCVQELLLYGADVGAARPDPSRPSAAAQQPATPIDAALLESEEPHWNNDLHEPNAAAGVGVALLAFGGPPPNPALFVRPPEDGDGPPQPPIGVFLTPDGFARPLAIAEQSLESLRAAAAPGAVEAAAGEIERSVLAAASGGGVDGSCDGDPIALLRALKAPGAFRPGGAWWGLDPAERPMRLAAVLLDRAAYAVAVRRVAALAVAEASTRAVRALSQWQRSRDGDGADAGGAASARLRQTTTYAAGMCAAKWGELRASEAAAIKAERDAVAAIGEALHRAEATAAELRRRAAW